MKKNYFCFMYKRKIIKVPRFQESEGFYTTKKLSEHMSKIRSTNTKPEKILGKKLWGLGLRYRKHVKKLPGKPDFVFNKYNVVIFIDGDFWHGYNWKKKKDIIKKNRDYWIPKIEKNIQRDKEQTELLIKMGYKVLRFWEHDVKMDFDACIQKILKELEKNGLVRKPHNYCQRQMV